jgi:hypothetical protein
MLQLLLHLQPLQQTGSAQQAGQDLHTKEVHPFIIHLSEIIATADTAIHIHSDTPAADWQSLKAVSTCATTNSWSNISPHSKHTMLLLTDACDCRHTAIT